VPATGSPEPSASSETPAAGSTAAPVLTPAPSGAPLQPTGAWFGLDPPIVLVGVVLLGSIGTLAALGLRRPPRRR